MNKVSRPALRAPLGRAASVVVSALRAPAALALAFAMLASLAPLGTVASAQVLTKGQYPVADESPTYVLYQTPDGDVSCRIALPGEVETNTGGQPPGLRQINHLRDKEAATTSGAGLTIILRGTAQLDAVPEAKAAFITAAAKWEALISSPITVTIDVDYGTTFFGNAYSSANTLGATSSGGYRIPYSNVRARLVSRAPAGSEEAALLNNLPATSALPTDIGDAPDVFVPPAMARALGFNIDEATAPVPRIGFNSNFTFDFNHTDGVAGTDFDSVAVHEIGHALGFNSRVGSRELSDADLTRPVMATVWDFYRFRPGAGTASTFSTAQRILSSGTTPADPHVSFTGAGELALSTGKPDGTGGDDEQSSHWKDDRLSGVFIGIMDPTLPRNRHEQITADDLRAIDFFGYSLGGVAPPPPPPAPANNNFASAQTISGSTGSAAGTNVSATAEGGEPIHSPDGKAGGKSVWYNWTAPSGGPVTFNTSGSSFDTVLAAYTGAAVNALSFVANNDDVASGNVTSAITFNAAGGTTYRIAVDGWDGDFGTISLNWSHTPSGGGGGQTPVVGFSTHAYTAAENAGAAVITVGRSNLGTEFSVTVRTIDDAAAVACNDTTTAPGIAFARCDYATTIDTVRFGAFDAFRTISVPLIDDSYGEPNESVDLEIIISTPGQVQMGVVPRTRLTITSNEAPGQNGATNPIGGVPFFVRQHYLDFLSREPEAGEPWSNVLNGCFDQFNLNAAAPSAGCDRIVVSASFFGSDEFALKGGYAFRFYKAAYGRLPQYAEIVSDMRLLTGATGPEVIIKRAAFPEVFAQRQDFALAFGGRTNQEFVDTLMNRYGIEFATGFHPSTPEGGAKISFGRSALVTALNGSQFTRAQVLRLIADSDEVSAAEFRPAFVAMQYYGYLRRTPEPQGYNNWLNYLNANPNDSRTMVNGFLNSGEYRLRFGQQ